MRLRNSLLPLLVLLAPAALSAPAAESQEAGAVPPPEPAREEAPAAEPVPEPSGGEDAAAAGAPLTPGDLAWLDEVGLLLYPEEQAVYESLSQDYQRRAFRERFWRLRDPYPRSATNELREAWSERRLQADQDFEGPEDPRRDALLLAGPPVQRLEARCPNLLPQLEVWFYDGSERHPSPLAVVFMRGGRRSWNWWQGRADLARLAFGGEAFGRSSDDLRRILVEGCAHGPEIVAGVDASLDRETFVEIHRPRVDLGWLESFRARQTELPPGASTFEAGVQVAYPGRQGSRTIVQTLIEVPAAAVTAAARVPTTPGSGAGSADDPADTAYDFVIDGEVLRGEELFENFRYRYRLPAGSAAEGKVPVLFERLLRPGDWRLVVRLEDREGGSFFRSEIPLEVPARAAAIVDTTQATGTGAAAPAGLGPPLAPSIQFLPLPRVLSTGNLRVEATTEGEGIDRVEFWLDGKAVLRKSTPPWSVALELGAAPRQHVLRAVALDARRQVLASDEAVLNGGAHRLEVQLVEPAPALAAVGTVRARARVEVPPGEALDRVEFHRNDTLIGTVYQPPYSLPIPLPEGEEIVWVQATACLVEGRCSSDLVFVRGPGERGELRVHAVELFTTVVDRRGRPVEGLADGDFTVLEDGVEQELSRFELAEDLSSSSVVLLDLSISMIEEIRDAEQTVLGFFEEVLSEKDRCAVMTFANEPQLVVPLTSEIEILRGGLGGLTAEGETALWDGVIHALHYLGGLEGRRALIVVSDGEDSKSRFTVDQALEYAARSQVTIYAIALKRGNRDLQARSGLQRLVEATGGRMFEVSSAGALGPVYEAIENELHSQYLLAYQSSRPGGDGFRRVEVRVDGQGRKARTLAGYYP